MGPKEGGVRELRKRDWNNRYDKGQKSHTVGTQQVDQIQNLLEGTRDECHPLEQVAAVA